MISSTVSSDASRTNILGSPCCTILKRTPGTNTVVRTLSTSSTSDHLNSTFGPEKMRSKARPRIPGREQRRLPPLSFRRNDTRGHWADITYPSSSCQLAPFIQTLSFTYGSSSQCTMRRARPLGNVPYDHAHELPRTRYRRSSQNSTSRHLGEAFSTVPHPPKLGH